MNTMSLIRPDDWHCHLRDGDYLARTVSDTAAQFGRAIVMPNLDPPITTSEQAQAYLQRIEMHIPPRHDFKPLLTLYLTDNTSVQTIQVAQKSGIITACKLYPAGATTHSAKGVHNIKNLYPIFEVMQACRLPLLIHAEIPDNDTDIFDREAFFIEKILASIIKQFPELRIVIEHISTKIGVEFVLSSALNIAATITPQHLLFNRNDLLAGGIKPHHYCLPILKRRHDQETLIHAAISGNPKFFLGTDSAPHSIQNKESICGCAGIYSAFSALELYAEVFSQQHALDKLEGFSSIFGAKFYGLPLNKTKITFKKQSWEIPQKLAFGATWVAPLWAGKTLQWQIEKSHE